MKKVDDKKTFDAVVKAFKKIQKDIDSEIRFLNKGGCGYFALYATNVLRRHKVRHKITCYGRRWEKFSDKIEAYKNKEGNLSACHFSIVILNEINIDGESTWTGKEWDGVYLKGYYTKPMIEAAIKYGSWNDTYDTSQNKKLEKIVNKFDQYFTEEINSKLDEE